MCVNRQVTIPIAASFHLPQGGENSLEPRPDPVAIGIGDAAAHLVWNLNFIKISN